MCHNPIFSRGIFLGVGAQNEVARAKSAWSDESLSRQITSEHGPGHISQNSGGFDQVWPRLTECWPGFDWAVPDLNEVHYAQKPSKGGPGYISRSLESFDQVWLRLTKFDKGLTKPLTGPKAESNWPLPDHSEEHEESFDSALYGPKTDEKRGSYEQNRENRSNT